MPRVKTSIALEIPEVAAVAEIKWFPTSDLQVSYRGVGWGVQPVHYNFKQMPPETTEKNNICASGALLFRSGSEDEKPLWTEDYTMMVILANGATWTLPRDLLQGCCDHVLEPRDSTAKNSEATVSVEFDKDGDNYFVKWVVLKTADAKPRVDLSEDDLIVVESTRGGRKLGTVEYFDGTQVHKAVCLANGRLHHNQGIVELTQWLRDMKATDGGPSSGAYMN